MADSKPQPHRQHLRVLELYSGIGGFHAALCKSSVPHTVVCAYDMNDHGNAVYAASHPHTPISTRNIGFLSPADLAAHAADLWMLSPPCQPYTRKGDRKGMTDTRADSFLRLLDSLAGMAEPDRPRYLLLENVLGFERSLTFDVMCRRLAETGYVWQALEMNPLDYGVPYSRPRLFVVAKRAGSFLAASSNGVVGPVPVVPGHFQRPGGAQAETRTIREYLDADNASTRAAHDALRVPERALWDAGRFFDIAGPDDRRSCCFTKAYGTYATGGGSVLRTDWAEGWEARMEAAFVEYRNVCDRFKPKKERMDVARSGTDAEAEVDKEVKTEEEVDADAEAEADQETDASQPESSPASSAPASPYAQFKRQPRKTKPKKPPVQPKWWTLLDPPMPCPLSRLGLRYFSPNEMARLHGFEVDSGRLVFPDSVTTIQRFKLIGNSLHVDIVRMLVEYLVAEPGECGGSGPE